MEWLREIFWLSATHNFHVTCKHIRGSENQASDCISRIKDSSQLNKFLAHYCHGLYY